MPVYNGDRYLAESIASVLGQTYSDFEFIIVDDGSTDGSAAISQCFAGRDPRIRLLLLAQNVGKGTARNRGIALASGEYIAMLDCDDICLPDRLRRQVDFLNANPQIGLLGCTLWDRGSRSGAPHSLCGCPQEHALIAWNLFFGWSIAGPAIMVRRGLLVAVEGYEEGREICDDMELLSRLIVCTRFANLPDILMLYRRHSQADSIKKQSLQQAAVGDIIERMLHALWGEAPEATVERFMRVRYGEKNFRRAERKLLRVEMMRLIDSFVVAGWVEADERPLLTEAMESELQRTMPRRRHFWKRVL